MPSILYHNQLRSTYRRNLVFADVQEDAHFVFRKSVVVPILKCGKEARWGIAENWVYEFSAIHVEPRSVNFSP